MKSFLAYIVHFVSAVFLFSVSGMGLAFLAAESNLIAANFQTAAIITVFLFIGLFFYFARVFLNGKVFALWEKKKASFPITAASLALIFTIAIKNGSLSTAPARFISDAFYLNGIAPTTLNLILVLVLIVGIAALAMGSRLPIHAKKEIKMEWDHLSKTGKTGMIVLFSMIAAFLLLYLGQDNVQSAVNHSVSYLKTADVEGFRDYLLSFGPLAAIVSAFLMVFQSVLAPLPAFVITFANGLLFGWFYGALLSWSSAMLGAILCFYIAKYLGRPVVEKIVTKGALEWWDRFFLKYGSHSVFLARLIPVVSFDLVSYAAGTTAIPFWKFFWATGLGQLPATILYSYLGKNATGTVQILFYLFIIVIALTVLGVIFKPMFNKKMEAAKEQSK